MSINSVSSSGQYINIDSLVQSALRVQQLRVSDLQGIKGTADSQISTLGKAKSQISSLEDKFKGINSALTNYSIKGAPESMTVKASGNGSYAVSVDSLASSQIISSKAASATGALGYAGKLSINTGSYDGANNFTADKTGINIDVAEGDTLVDIAKKINDSNSGVNASIINAKDGPHLALSSGTTGATNAFEIKAVDANNTGLSALAYQQGVSNQYNNVEQAKDGVATINGVSVTSSDNNFSANKDFSFIATATVANQKISVKSDNDAIKKAITDFVSAYNSTSDSLKSMDINYQLKNFGTQLRSTLGSSEFSESLTNMGLNFDKSGVLSFDATKFNNLTSNNSGDLSKLINKHFGSDSKGQKMFDKITDAEGVIDNQVNSLQTRSKKLGTNISDAQSLLTTQATQYRLQFSKIDEYIGQLNNNSNTVTQLMSQFSTKA